jgi:hypothetical protein
MNSNKSKLLSNYSLDLDQNLLSLDINSSILMYRITINLGNIFKSKIARDVI